MRKRGLIVDYVTIFRQTITPLRERRVALNRLTGFVVSKQSSKDNRRENLEQNAVNFLGYEDE